MRKPKKVFVTVRSVEFEMKYEIEVEGASPAVLALFESAHGVVVHHFGLDRPDHERGAAVATQPPTAEGLSPAAVEWERIARAAMAMYDWSTAEARSINDFILTARESAAEMTIQPMNWLGGLLDDEGNLLLSRIPYPDGPVVRIATHHNGDGDEQRLAESDWSKSVTAGLREAINIAVNRVPA